MNYRKKLIEVALPLDEISAASIREKSLRHGHPSTLHLWWSRKPLATSRAVLFASMVDDPSSHPELFPTEEQQDEERKRLFNLIKLLVVWENSNDPRLLRQAHDEMVKYAPDGKLPPFLDPFAGGGSIPLEAQRLGLESHASDLNPVAVLLNKAMIELPPRFANRPPINPEAKKELVAHSWRGSQGLANDVAYYGKWLRDEAQKRIGHLYPTVTVTNDEGEESEATVIAWLWVRTVKCPNPACGAEMPLASKWWLSTKKGKEAWVVPQVDHEAVPPTVSYAVHKKDGNEKPLDGTVNRQGAKCIACDSSVPFDYIRSEGRAGRMGAQLIAIVADGQHGRAYLAPDEAHIRTADISRPDNIELTDLPEQALSFRVQVYGMVHHQDLFTPRQLIALTTFSDLLHDAQQKVSEDYAGSDGNATLYVQAVVTYLALAIDKNADYWSAICSWHSGRDTLTHTFARQSIPMVWDFAEANPFSESTGNFLGAIEWIVEVLNQLPASAPGEAIQRDAMTMLDTLVQPVISTDPPYYDNVGYADLSDFFYVWLRRSLSDIYPELFGTLLTPKAQELIATPYRFEGSKQRAQEFFEGGLNQTFAHIRAIHHPDYPLTVYYAFKQSEAEVITDGAEKEHDKKQVRVASTGWETMLSGLIEAGFTITGTWPLRTEMMNRSVSQKTNALASSILLVCRPRPVNAPLASRRQFINELRSELAEALRQMQHGTIAPVDLAQASIGPGMAIYSRYKRVIESDGSPLSVRTALQLINRELDSVLADQEGEYDVETRWAVAWFEENAQEKGDYGRAEVLSKAKNVSVEHMEAAGIVESGTSHVRLLRREELRKLDEQKGLQTQRERGLLTTWEVLQRTIHALDKDGDVGAARVLAQVPEYRERVRDLAYRLHNICERKGWSGEALYYNMLVTSWDGANREARSLERIQHIQQQPLL